MSLYDTLEALKNQTKKTEINYEQFKKEAIQRLYQCTSPKKVERFYRTEWVNLYISGL